MLYPSPRPRTFFNTAVALLVCSAAAWSANAGATQKTVCTVTINSPDERDSFERHLPRDGYRVVELVKHGHPDWLASACRSGVSCDALVISGHFDNGTEFYTDSFVDHEALTLHEMQSASCSASCNGLFSQLKEVYLFGCNTLKAQPTQVASAEVARSLVRSGHAPAEAARLSALMNERYGQSNRDRLRHVFKNVPVLYGFASQAPLGRTAGPLLERYFQTAPAGEVARGRPSPTLLGLFAPSSMVAVQGLTDADANADFRADVCGLADDKPPPAQKIAFMHQLLQREAADVRMVLDHLEHFASSISPAQRQLPEEAMALGAIESDLRSRERFLAFARDADVVAVQTRMLALARSLGWLSPAQERAEFVRMVAGRMDRGSLSGTEVDLVCSSHPGREPGEARQLLATGAVRPGDLTHAAALACMGSTESHERTVRALSSPRHEDVAIAQIYLRHRPLSGVGELRVVTSNIGRMAGGDAQLRALETLARQRLADPQSLQEIAGLFPLVRTLEAQRAIAGILIRADYRMLARADLARTLSQHRLKSRSGSDVIDVLIRLLRSA
ncbi:MAG: hypothetical protein KA185_03575 [Vitreoscilla sp.]|nr:hypothetical protein [Vitreoscilla sp.]